MPPNPEAFKKERPCRTLFVRNLAYNVTEPQLRELFASYGEIAKIKSLIHKRGIVFITYYDIRHAEAAKTELQGRDISGRELDIHYSVPKDDETAEFHEDRNQGSLFITIRGSKQNIKASDLREKFAPYGDLKGVRDCRNNPYIKFVDYYDTRHAEAALNALNQFNFQGATLEVEFALSYAQQQARKEQRMGIYQGPPEGPRGGGPPPRFQPSPPSRQWGQPEFRRDSYDNGPMQPREQPPVDPYLGVGGGLGPLSQYPQLAGLNPQQLAGLNPQQLAQLAGLGPQMNVQQQVPGMNPQMNLQGQLPPSLAGLGSSLSGLNLSPQELLTLGTSADPVAALQALAMEKARVAAALAGQSQLGYGQAAPASAPTPQNNLADYMALLQQSAAQAQANQAAVQQQQQNEATRSATLNSLAQLAQLLQVAQSSAPGQAPSPYAQSSTNLASQRLLGQQAAPSSAGPQPAALNPLQALASLVLAQRAASAGQSHI